MPVNPDAAHEAGHAVAAIRLGIELLRVSLDGPMPGQTDVLVPKWPYGFPRPNLQQDDVQVIEELAIYHWSGPAAREMLTGSAPLITNLDDEINLRKLARHLEADKSDGLVERISAFKQSSREFVRDEANSRSIVAVTQLLEERRTLDVEAVRSVVVTGT